MGAQRGLSFSPLASQRSDKTQDQARDFLPRAVRTGLGESKVVGSAKVARVKAVQRNQAIGRLRGSQQNLIVVQSQIIAQ